MNVSEYMSEFIDRKSYSWAASTAAQYRNYAKLIGAALGQIEISEVKPKHNDILAAKLKSSKDSSGAHHVMIFFHQVLADAFKNGDTQIQPERTKAPTRENTIKSHLDYEVIQKVISHVETHYQPIFKFLALTGARPCEAFALTWKDVYFEQKLITIDKGMVRSVAGKTKTGRSRNVFITPALARLLQSLDRNSEFVFTTKKGEQYKSNHLDRLWRTAAHECGVDAVAYTLRHSFATKLIAENVNLAAVSKMMGHSTIRTTSNYYVGITANIEMESEAQLQQIYG